MSLRRSASWRRRSNLTNYKLFPKFYYKSKYFLYIRSWDCGVYPER